MSSRRIPGPNSYPVVRSIDESELANYNRTHNRPFSRTPSRRYNQRNFNYTSNNNNSNDNFGRRNNGVNFQNRLNNGHHRHLPIRSNPQNLDLDIIGSFHCPFQEENSCIFETDPLKCYFAHPETSSERQNLRSLPNYVCPFFVIKRCYYHELPRCYRGLHLLWEDLIDLEKFEQTNETRIINFYNRFAYEDQHECNICYEKVKQKRLRSSKMYAILENCDHIFCRVCLVKVRQNSISCPVCRVNSTRYVIRENLFSDEQQKKHCFQSSPDVIQDEPTDDITLYGPLSMIQEDRVLYLDLDDEEDDYPLRPLPVWNQIIFN